MAPFSSLLINVTRKEIYEKLHCRAHTYNGVGAHASQLSVSAL